MRFIVRLGRASNIYSFAVCTTGDISAPPFVSAPFAVTYGLSNQRENFTHNRALRSINDPKQSTAGIFITPTAVPKPNRAAKKLRNRNTTRPLVIEYFHYQKYPTAAGLHTVLH